MKHLKIISVLFCSMIFSLTGFAQTTDEVIDNYIKAVGGVDKINAIKTARVYAKLTSKTSAVDVILTFKQPNMALSVITSNGQSMKTGYNGKVGWSLFEVGEKAEPYILPEDQLKPFAKESDLASPLINYKDKGSKVELLGTEKHGDKDAFKLKLTDKNGDNNIYLIDAKDYLIVKEIRTYKFPDRDDVTEFEYSNYQPVDGFLFPFTYEVKASKDTVDNQEVRVTKVETNFPVDDEVFGVPKSK